MIADSCLADVRRTTTAEDLGLEPAPRPIVIGAGTSLEARLLAAEVKIVSETLEQHAGHRRATARALGISERTLRHKLKQWRDNGIVTAA
jgi:two-component system response regulator FlrC